MFPVKHSGICSRSTADEAVSSDRRTEKEKPHVSSSRTGNRHPFGNNPRYF